MKFYHYLTDVKGFSEDFIKYNWNQLIRELLEKYITYCEDNDLEFQPIEEYIYCEKFGV